MQQLFRRFLPFLFTVITVLVLIFGMVLLFYFLLFSLALGIVLSLYRFIRAKLKQPEASKVQRKDGHRIIDAEEWKEL